MSKFNPLLFANNDNVEMPPLENNQGTNIFMLIAMQNEHNLQAFLNDLSALSQAGLSSVLSQVGLSSVLSTENEPDSMEVDEEYTVNQFN